MTRPNFYEGIHPQLDPDIAAQRQEAYMTKLERTIDEDMVSLNDFEKLEQQRDELQKELKLWKKLSKAQDKLLLAYRFRGRTPGKALDDIAGARAALAKLEGPTR